MGALRVTWLAFAVGLAGLPACQEAPIEPLDASIDQSAPPCTSSNECAGGAVCVYPMLVGCKAKGECREFMVDEDLGGCTAATTACGCDGKTVDVPACWMGFAPAPVFMNGPTKCTDAH